MVYSRCQYCDQYYVIASLMIWMTECILSKFVGDIKLEGVIDIPDGHAAIQGDLNRLER